MMQRKLKACECKPAIAHVREVRISMQSILLHKIINDQVWLLEMKYMQNSVKNFKQDNLC